MSARVDQAAAFLAARPRPTGEDWEREAWRRQLTKLIIDVEWSDEEARALATRLSPEAAARLELWHAVLTPALRAALEVAHPLDDAQRAQREAEVLEEALRTGALTEALLHEAAATTVVALLEATQFDLFGHCATVLTLLEPARELDGLPRRVAEVRESLAGRRAEVLRLRPGRADLRPLPRREEVCHDGRMARPRRAPEHVSPPRYERDMTTQTDIPSLQLEVLKNIQAELSGLRSEVNGLRTDLDTGLASVRAELADVRSELREGLADVRTEMHEGFTRLRTEVVGLRGDMDVGFTALRMQSDRRFLDHERRLRDLEASADK